MSELAIRESSANPRWPMTNAAWQRLVDDLGQLRADAVTLARTMGPDDAVLQLPVIKAARRYELLTAVLDAAEQVHEPNRAVIGRCVTLREDDGETLSFMLVVPGDGDPAQGWISADSPLGAAVLGSSPGEVVNVVAPAGHRVVTVLSVD